MFPQTIIKTKPDIRLPFLFILFALLSFLTAQGLLMIKADAVIEGVYRSPAVWAAAHLLVLGWGAMVAMGAMYQLVPVAFLVQIWSIRLGFVQFIITAIGIISLAISFSINPGWLVVSGGLTVIGILLFLFQMAMTIQKQKEKNIISLFIITALFCLFVTIVFGLLLAASLGSGLSFFDHGILLKSHILLGLAGWFTLLIMGFSYKLVPMFSLAHGFTMKLGYWGFTVYAVGLAFTTASFFQTNQIWLTIGFTLLFIGFSLFVFHIGQLLKKRMKKRLDNGVTFSLASIAGGWLLHLSVVIVSLLTIEETVYMRIIYLYIIIWITFSICGYLSKIVPFLWWTHKYSKRAGQKGTPLLKDMISERFAATIFMLFAISVIGSVISFVFPVEQLFLLSQTLFFIATAFFCIMILNVMTK